jgi:hypothetical protein
MPRFQWTIDSQITRVAVGAFHRCFEQLDLELWKLPDHQTANPDFSLLSSGNIVGIAAQLLRKFSMR